MPTNLIEQLQRDEGWSGSAYQDSEGYWTIGYGTCIDSKVGCSISREEGDLLLSNRAQEAQDKLKAAFDWTASMDEVRLGVLQNMCYNMGISRLAQFKNMLAACQRRDYGVAAQEMRNSKWYTQVGARGERLALQMEDGQWH